MTAEKNRFLVLLVCILLTAGCTMPLAADPRTAGTAGNAGADPARGYQRTIAQPMESAQLIKMDTDVYNVGEVVEFVIVNSKTSDLPCTNSPPAFSVRYQAGNGRWVTRMGEENPGSGNITPLRPGESTAPYRFVTDGWTPGRYRIVTGCDVSREILLRALPAATPAVTPCPAGANESAFIRINPVNNQYPGEPFTITGTTNLPAGSELRYSVFAILSASDNLTSARLASSSATVAPGSCGINTWLVEGVIEVPGDYFIGVSSADNTVSAVKRFSVLSEPRATVTATLPVKVLPPGISTG